MNKRVLIMLLVIPFCFSALGQIQYSLEQILDLAKSQSPLAKQAETRKENRYWQYRLFKSDYNPQLTLGGNLPGYSRQFVPVTQPDGTLEFRPVEQTSARLNLGLIQPISATGGTLSINTNSSRFNNQLTDITSYRSTVADVTLIQPLFAFNGLRWDKKTEPLRFEESKRSYVEEMEFVSRTGVERFFDYLDAQVNFQIANFNLANNDTIYNIERGRYNIGTTSEDKLLQVELQLLRSKQDLSSAKLGQQTARLNMRTFIGLNESEEFDLLLPEQIPLFLVDETMALQQAMANRSAFISFARRKLEADRQVAQAKGQRFNMDLNASVGLNSAGTTLSQSYMDPNSQQLVNISLLIPIVNWGRNEARMQTALANKRLTDYTIAQEEQNFELEIITLVRQLEMLRQQIEIANKSDEVAQKRYEVAQNRYLIGKIDITNLNIALTEKDNARRSYINALRSYWIAYFDLRRLTLYDFESDQLLYTSED
jgi:outer membrane protein TolC